MLVNNCAISEIEVRLENDELAQEHYQQFKRGVVAGFERDRFLITQAEIRCWIAALLSGPDEP